MTRRWGLIADELIDSQLLLGALLMAPFFNLQFICQVYFSESGWVSCSQIRSLLRTSTSWYPVNDVLGKGSFWRLW